MTDSGAAPIAKPGTPVEVKAPRSGLRLESVSKVYPARGRDLVIFRDINLEIAAGESLVIVGPSGSGKSTLLNVIGTLEPPSSGRVRINGVDPFELSESALAAFRNQSIGFIFQEHHLLPQCTALENVLLPTLASHHPRNQLDRARQLLDRVGLSDRLDHRPGELSGGERQRTAIARSLMNEPNLVLADEPTGNLDRATGESIGTLLLNVVADRDAMLIVVTHSERLAERFDRRFELEGGTLAPRRD